MSTLDGRFVWYELVTPDPEAAIGFYQNVIGWDRKKMEGTGEPYQMFARGDQTVAGIMKLSPGPQAHPHWLGYIGTSDVDRTAAQVEEKGGSLHVRPQEIPTIGKFAVMRDPQGAYIAMFTPQGPPPPAQPPAAAIGDFGWHELVTTDVEAAIPFYGDLFGWEKKEAHDMGHMGIYQIYGTKEKALGGMYKKPADMPAPPHWLFYVRVADLDAAVQKVSATGGKVLYGPSDVPGGDRIATCMDPQGATFALVT